MTVDFIGIGAQKTGTSWVYTCLYEHPEICIPIKEIHFFSRSRFEKGITWYERHFAKCHPDKKKGEFSTSYMYSESAPKRIKSFYPDVKLIAILRNPVERAYSQYRNAIKSGEIDRTASFDEYASKEKSVLEQGKYAEQLDRYRAYFDEEQILLLVYEDSRISPELFIRRIYQFLDVDISFVPSMLDHEINAARTPKFISAEKAMHRVAEFLRKRNLGHVVHSIKKSGLPDWARSLNTVGDDLDAKENKKIDWDPLRRYFYDDATHLSRVLDRDLASEWNLKS